MPAKQTHAPAYPKIMVGIEPDAFQEEGAGQIVAITAKSAYDEFAGQVVFRAEDAEAICLKIMDAAAKIAKRKAK